MEYFHGMMEMQEVAHRAYELRLISGDSGNISVRVRSGRKIKMIISASGISLGDLESEHFLPYPEDNYGDLQPSSEADLHAALYDELPDVEAILHYHGTWTRLVAEMADEDCWRPSLNLPELFTFSQQGEICVVQKQPAGSRELIDSVIPLAREKKADALILRGHGGITWGETPEEALFVAESLETLAKTDYFYRLGGPSIFEGSD